jgi:hypothetical protein
MRKTLTIETKPEREGQKSRSFSVELLAYVVANNLWELGSGGKERTHRPVFMAYAGTDQSERSFSANLRKGRPASEGAQGYGLRFELPRSAGFRYDSYSRSGAALTLCYLPSLFSVHPGTAELPTISFLCMPPTWWVEQQSRTIINVMGSCSREAAIAAYFVAFLDQRSPLPIANDLKFHLELYRAAQAQSWCLTTSGCEINPGTLFHTDLQEIGFEPAIYCHVDQQTFSEFLAAQTSIHLSKESEINYGETGISRPRRVFPNTHRPTAQLSLFGELQPA